MCVCVCVCVCACWCVRARARARVCVYACGRACVRTCWFLLLFVGGGGRVKLNIRVFANIFKFVLFSSPKKVSSTCTPKIFSCLFCSRHRKRFLQDVYHLMFTHFRVRLG